MYIVGLHAVDFAIVVFYLLLMLYIGKKISESIKNQRDFFLAGRKLGRLLQFFLNFGQMTDANGAVAASSVVFENGIGGIWMGFCWIFMTPYYWFMNKWFRRVRLVTMSELFEERFGGQSLALLYAVVNVVVMTLAISIGYVVSVKTAEAIMVKPVEKYTVSEIEMTKDYKEYKELEALYNRCELQEENRDRYNYLQGLAASGKIKPYISYADPLVVMISYSVIVGVYVMLGGFRAAAITDAIQGVLIILISVILVPFGVIKSGGFSGLHSRVPDYMFNFFGDVHLSEFNLHSMLAILLVSWVAINGNMSNMAVAGSAKSEFAARFGAVSGGLTKRLMLVFWGFCGLIAVSLFSQDISDPDMSWGVLTRGLLPVGLIGLMLAGLLAANMSSLDAWTVTTSALFVRNIYIPLVKNKGEQHYIWVGRLVIPVMLILGMMIAFSSSGIVEIYKFLLSVGPVFGAPCLLIFLWRRLTKRAVLVQVLVCLLMFVIIPASVPLIPGLNRHPALTLQTEEKQILHEARACQEDVDSGLASYLGDPVSKKIMLDPVSLYFDRLVPEDPYNPDTIFYGAGRFNFEIFLLEKAGFDMKCLTASSLLAVRCLFNAIVPFVLLFVISYSTKPGDTKRLDRFYVKMRTEVQGDPIIDNEELEKSYTQPDRFDHKKLFPGSDWEFSKWNKTDVLGFVLSWIAVVGILAVMWILLNVGV